MNRREKREVMYTIIFIFSSIIIIGLALVLGYSGYLSILLYATRSVV